LARAPGATFPRLRARGDRGRAGRDGRAPRGHGPDLPQGGRRSLPPLPPPGGGHPEGPGGEELCPHLGNGLGKELRLLHPHRGPGGAEPRDSRACGHRGLPHERLGQLPAPRPGGAAEALRGPLRGGELPRALRPLHGPDGRGREAAPPGGPAPPPPHQLRHGGVPPHPPRGPGPGVPPSLGGPLLPGL
jgi:hypothetical protein